MNAIIYRSGQLSGMLHQTSMPEHVQNVVSAKANAPTPCRYGRNSKKYILYLIGLKERKNEE